MDVPDAHKRVQAPHADFAARYAVKAASMLIQLLHWLVVAKQGLQASKGCQVPDLQITVYLDSDLEADAELLAARSKSRA